MFRQSPAPLVLAADARTAGLRLETTADAVRVRRGVYTSLARWEELRGWDRYLVRAHALALVRPDAVFSHEAAAALWGLPVFGHPRDVHVFDGRRARSLRYGDVTVHTSADRRRCVRDGEICATTVADTVADLVRCLPLAFGLAVGDAAARAHPHAACPALVRETVAAQRNARGRARLAWVLDRITGCAESVGESVSRAVIEWCGFPPPALQQAHHVEGRHYRSDFAWPERDVIGESDGWGKYGTGEEAGRALRAEKEREYALQRAGWRVARWDMAGAIRVDDLRDALLAAGLRPTRRADAVQLRLVGRNPRSR